MLLEVKTARRHETGDVSDKEFLCGGKKDTQIQDMHNHTAQSWPAGFPNYFPLQPGLAGKGIHSLHQTETSESLHSDCPPLSTLHHPPHLPARASRDIDVFEAGIERALVSAWTAGKHVPRYRSRASERESRKRNMSQDGFGIY